MPAPPASRRRGSNVLAVVVVALVAATGCTATYGAETQVQRVSTNGAAADTGVDGSLKVRNVVAVADAEGRATLVGVVINYGEDDALVGIDVANGSAELGAPPAGGLAVTEDTDTGDNGGRIELPGGATTRIGSGEPEAETVVLEGEGVVPGLVVRLTLRFETAASVNLDVNVTSNVGPYADVPIP